MFLTIITRLLPWLPSLSVCFHGYHVFICLATGVVNLDCASICGPDGPVTEKRHDVFISYRRSNGSQLAR